MKKLINKGEMIQFILENSNEFKAIDSAIPQSLWKEYDPIWAYGYAYCKNGTSRIICLPVEIATIQRGCYVQKESKGA